MSTPDTVSDETETRLIDDDQSGIFEPQNVLEKIPEEYSDIQTLVMIAAVRNPYTTPAQLDELLGGDEDVSGVNKTLTSYAHGTIGTKGKNQVSRTSAPEGYDDLSPKQKAMCDFFAKWPLAADELNYNELANAITVTEGEPVSYSYPGQFLKKYDDIIADRRQELEERGEVPETALPNIDGVFRDGNLCPELALQAGGVRALPSKNLDLEPDNAREAGLSRDEIEPPAWVEEIREKIGVGTAHADQSTSADNEALDEIPWQCPVCDRVFDEKIGASSHVATVHSDEKERVLEDWGAGSEKLWVAILRYTIEERDLDLDLEDVLDDVHQRVIETVNENPRQFMREVAVAAETTRETVRYVRATVPMLLPDEWLAHLEASRRSYASGIAEDETEREAYEEWAERQMTDVDDDDIDGVGAHVTVDVGVAEDLTDSADSDEDGDESEVSLFGFELPETTACSSTIESEIESERVLDTRPDVRDELIEFVEILRDEADTERELADPESPMYHRASARSVVLGTIERYLNDEIAVSPTETETEKT